MKETPKFLRKETMVIVDASFSPKDTTVEGKFGKRKMNIINTTDYGLIYISDTQLMKIVDSLRAANFENVTVTL